MKTRYFLIAMVGVLLISMFALAIPAGATATPTPAPTATASGFNIDTGPVMDSASTMFNGLWPAMALVAGIALGTGLLVKIVGEIRKAF